MVDQVKMEEIVAAIRAGEKTGIDDGIDLWTFNAAPAHEKEMLGRQYLSLAENVSQQYLYRRTDDAVSAETRLYLIEENKISLHNYSLRELINKKEIIKVAAAMREGQLKEYQSWLDQYAGCPGCLYWITLELSLAVYDERAPMEWDAISQQLFKQLAEGGDARACHELANHYYFNTSEKDEVIKWRQRAIAEGESEDLKELADFIIDEYPEKIVIALDTLHSMQENGLHMAWAWWKEGHVYTQGIGTVKPDPAKGFALIQKASELGLTVAKGDLAYHYHKGIGVPKDLHKALELLEEANEASRTFNNQQFYSPDEEGEGPVEEGDYEEQIEMIRKELDQ
ncbi:hypothetical protein [Paraflavitalea sp. CAU 1676]|uniref:tetratricopeptide repeat protein n=1 Tax=Paraflavitalea sp. CAU 1676 TaxID=3032598 RepID=UPI0023DB75A9|nr:hypothetical protein [Paraflavitalea sp. CAU 1676]MDF2189566.1 hypothetical protein [Paraflavitalea sp. CAU 1676]